MSHYQIGELIQLWAQEKLTAEQAIGQLLQQIQALAQRIGQIEQRLEQLRRREDGPATDGR